LNLPQHIDQMTGRDRQQEEIDEYERIMEEDKTDFERIEEAQQAEEMQADYQDKRDGYHWLEDET
ncbi:hypothetical protein, partial [Vibrio anguillarum]